ncbi:MAG: high frequency lysogenization protein HflD [Gammaproteobacteria bacterium]|nr:high frequency lysogenization protein HflD [Gammaproteobacteria bacterium]
MQVNTLRSQTIALSAMCQSALMIQQASVGNTLNSEQFNNLLQGILVTSPNSIFDVYNNIYDLSDGSALAIKQLSGQANSKDVELTRYLAGIMALSKRVLKNQESLDMLQLGIEQVTRRLDHFELTDPSIVENFADIYSKAISPLGQKIQVIGKPEVLKQPNTQNKVRALLLAGVRAAVFWRQMGGKRRQFIFSRKQILQEALLFNKELSTI